MDRQHRQLILKTCSSSPRLLPRHINRYCDIAINMSTFDRVGRSKCQYVGGLLPAAKLVVQFADTLIGGQQYANITRRHLMNNHGLMDGAGESLFSTPRLGVVQNQNLVWVLRIHTQSVVLGRRFARVGVRRAIAKCWFE